MLFILSLFFLFFVPENAWAYFDPGFGGYAVNTIVTMVVSGLAFVASVIVYFFRTIIAKRILLIWQKYEKFFLILLMLALGILSFFTGKFLCRLFYDLYGNPSVSTGEGVHIIDPQSVYQGYNLFDGKLFDEDGRIVKQWSNHYLGVIDKNGDYYAQQSLTVPLWGRYSWNNEPIWEKHFFIHHELYLSPKGTIFTFIREPHDYNNHKVDFDVILEFDKNGRQLQRYCFWDHLKEFQPYHPKYWLDSSFHDLPWTSLARLWQRIWTDHGDYSYPKFGNAAFFRQIFRLHTIFQRAPFDYFHINSFFMVPPNALEGKNPAFRPGNWLISVRHGSMVFILDQDTKKVLWHAVAHEVEGDLDGQHAVSMLPDGDILIFDNGLNRKRSRILLINPLTLKIKWQYSDKHFFTADAGFVQALPNGNFLITESEKGHVFELTRDKRIVWKGYTYRYVYRVVRYAKAMIDRLLKK